MGGERRCAPEISGARGKGGEVRSVESSRRLPARGLANSIGLQRRRRKEQRKNIDIMGEKRVVARGAGKSDRESCFIHHKGRGARKFKDKDLYHLLEVNTLKRRTGGNIDSIEPSGGWKKRTLEVETKKGARESSFGDIRKKRARSIHSK